MLTGAQKLYQGSVVDQVLLPSFILHVTPISCPPIFFKCSYALSPFPIFVCLTTAQATDNFYVFVSNGGFAAPSLVTFNLRSQMTFTSLRTPLYLPCPTII